MLLVLLTHVAKNTRRLQRGLCCNTKDAVRRLGLRYWCCRAEYARPRRSLSGVRWRDSIEKAFPGSRCIGRCRAARGCCCPESTEGIACARVGVCVERTEEIWVLIVCRRIERGGPERTGAILRICAWGAEEGGHDGGDVR